MARRPPLLEQIEQAALDDTADITGALRKCVVLGGQSVSEELRTWATRELKGYNANDQLPEYRTRSRSRSPSGCSPKVPMALPRALRTLFGSQLPRSSPRRL